MNSCCETLVAVQSPWGGSRGAQNNVLTHPAELARGSVQELNAESTFASVLEDNCSKTGMLSILWVSQIYGVLEEV